MFRSYYSVCFWSKKQTSGPWDLTSTKIFVVKNNRNLTKRFYKFYKILYNYSQRCGPARRARSSSSSGWTTAPSSPPPPSPSTFRRRPAPPRGKTITWSRTTRSPSEYDCCILKNKNIYITKYISVMIIIIDNLRL